MTPNWTLHAKGSNLSSIPLHTHSHVWWALSANRNHTASQRRLQVIYEANHDIRCSCSGARMFVRYLQSGKYTVVNHPIEGRHTKKCSLYTTINGFISDKEYGGECEFKEILTFCYHADINSTDVTEQDRPHKRNPDKKHRRQKLLRLLYQLCSEAFMHTYLKPLTVVVGEDEKQELRSFAKIRSAASSIKFGGSTLDHYIFYGHNGEQYAERSLSSKIWKGAGRRHVFLVEMVDIIETNYSELLFDGKPVFYERIIRPGLKASSGPFMVLSSLVDYEGELFRHTACVKPIVSRAIPMLIDSNYERNTALHLIKNILEHTDRSKSDYWSLQKPLIPRSSNDGTQVLPDFILTHKINGKKHFSEIIEVMGTDDDAYVERKKRLIPEMKQKFYSQRVAEIKAYIPGSVEHYADTIRELMITQTNHK